MKKQQKQPKTKVSKRIELRVTEEFFQDLNSKIQDSGLSQSEFLRQSLSQDKVVIKKDYTNMIIQTQRAGLLLNQLCIVLHVANRKNALNNYDYQALLVELKLIQNQLNRIGA
jgi:hypothetical protein